MGRPLSDKVVSRVEVDGPLAFETVVPALWFAIRSRWKVEEKIELPSWDKLKNFGRIKDLRILMRDVTITITFTDSSWYQFKFKKGWLTDLASVPWFFRSIVDNDDSELLPAAMVHDFLFSTHKLNFSDTNELLYVISKHMGYKPSLAWFAWAAVSSPAGRIRWKANARKRCGWTELTAEFMMARAA